MSAIRSDSVEKLYGCGGVVIVIHSSCRSRE
jgi:hypothetical protein